MKYLLATTFAVFMSLSAYTEATPDDMDNDGLVEINSLEELQAVGDFFGESTYGYSCWMPISRPYCRGLELTRDLDFDTNQNGKFDEGDTFWNGGEGWQPISLFKATFEGNGFAIRNLTINRPNATQQGLFRYVSYSSYVRNLVLTNVSIKALDTSGALTGLANECQISWVFATGEITGADGSYALGGLIGSSTNSNISSVFTSVNVTADRSSGAVIGHVEEGTGLYSALAVGKVNLSVGDKVGFGDGGEGSFGGNYIATDVSALPYDRVSDESGNSGALLSELKCPTYEGDTNCPGKLLYEGWSNSTANNTYWDFGSDQELPGMVLNFRLHRVDVNIDSSSSSSSSSSAQCHKPGHKSHRHNCHKPKKKHHH